MPKLANDTKRLLQNISRIVISVGLMIYVLVTIDLQTIWATITQANVWLITIGALAIAGASSLFSALRWHTLLKVPAYEVSHWRVWKILQTSAFYGFFAPGLMGKEWARWLKISASQHGQRMSAAVSVLLDRIIGVTALIIMGSFITLFYPSGLVPPPIRIVVALLMMATLCFWLAIIMPIEQLLPERLLHRTNNILEKLKLRLGIFSRAIESIQAYRGKWSIVLLATAWSMLFHLTNGLMYWVWAHAIDLNVSYSGIFQVYTVSSLLTSLPVSFQGIGVRDVSIIGLLAQLGYPRSRAAALPIIRLGIGLAWSIIIGGGLELLSGFRGVMKKRPAEIEPPCEQS